MEDWHFWVPTGISLIAVAFSAASWRHNLSAHSERRFGEIIKLRSGVLQRVTRVREQLSDLNRGMTLARYSLRLLPDSIDKKYEWIEKAPALEKELDDYVARAVRLRQTIDSLPLDENSTRHLQVLQLLEHELGTLEQGAAKITPVAEDQIEALKHMKKREEAEREAEREARYEELTRSARGDEPKTLPKT
jgi:hypothetical protein